MSALDRHLTENAADAGEGYALLRDHCPDPMLSKLIDALEASHKSTIECLRMTNEKLTVIELNILAAAERNGA